MGVQHGEKVRILRQEDGSDLSESAEDEVTKPRKLWRWSLFFASALALAFVLAAVFGAGTSAGSSTSQLRLSPPLSVVFSECTYAESKSCPAADIFASKEVLEAATENLMWVGHDLLGKDDRGMVLDAVSSGFADILVRMWAHVPGAANAFRSAQLDKEHYKSMVATLRLMCDPQVRALGHRVAEILRASNSSSEALLRRQIEVGLLGMLPDIAGMREVLLPPLILEALSKAPPWAMTLDVENVRVIQAAEGGKLAPVLASQEDLFMQDVVLRASAQDVLGAVLEVARELLYLVKFAALEDGLEVETPAWLTSLTTLANGASRIQTSDVGSCELDTRRHVRINFMKALFCPLKYGAMGLDAMVAVDDIRESLQANREAAGTRPAAQLHELPAPRSTSEEVEEEQAPPLRPVCTFVDGKACPAIDLLASPEVLEAATESLMRSAGGLLRREDLVMVETAVVTGFQATADILRSKDPDYAGLLDKVQVTIEEKNAAAACLRLLCDPRVQRIGFEVAQALRESSTHDAANLRRAVEQRLGPHLSDIRLLRDELVPELLHEVWGQRDHWEMTFAPDNVDLMQQSQGGELLWFNTSIIPAEVTKGGRLDSSNILAAILLEGTVSLHIVQLFAHLQGKARRLPAATGAERRPHLDSCELGPQPSTLNGMKALYCHLSYGMQGFDALAAGGMVSGGRRKEGAKEQKECVYGETPVCPASSLFVSHEVHAVAAENLLRVGSRLIRSEDHALVRSAASASLAHVGQQIRQRAPRVEEALEGIQLSRVQAEAVLSTLRLLTDPRVQGIGYEVAEAMRQGASADPDHVWLRIKERLQPFTAKLRSLRDELVPSALREVWGARKPWELTLQPENIEVMRATSGGALLPLEVGPENLWLEDEVIRISEPDLLGGLLEQSRALVGIVQTCALLSGEDLSVPTWMTSLSLVDTMQFGSFHTDLASCEISVDVDITMNFMKAILCPLKYGTQGIEALSSVGMIMRKSEGCSFAFLSMCPSEQLFLDAEVQSAVAENLMWVSRNLLEHSGREAAEAAAAQGLADVIAELSQGTPEVVHSVLHQQITDAQKNAVLQSVRLLSDARVQAVGYAVSRAIRAADSSEKGSVRRAILEALQPRLWEIRRLRKELMTGPLQEVWDLYDPWALTLEPSNVWAMQSTNGGVLVPPNASLQELGLHDVVLTADPQDFMGAVVAQGQILLQMVRLCARAFGRSVDDAAWGDAVAALQKLEMDEEDGERGPLKTCDTEFSVSASQEGTQAASAIFLRATVCALKYGTQGLEAMAAVEGMIALRKQRLNFGGACLYSKVAECPASELFMSAEIHEVVSESLMWVGQHLISPSDRDVVTAASMLGFANFSTQLQKHAPEVADTLGTLQLSEVQKDAVRHALMLQHNPRVQSIGFEIAKVIRAKASASTADLRSAIYELLQPRAEEIRSLSSHLVPMPLREVWGGRSLWSLTLDPENVHALQEVSNAGPLVPLNVTPKDIFLQNGAPLRVSIHDFVHAILEVRRVLVDLVKMCSRLFGKELEIPSWASSVNLVGNFKVEAVSCELDSGGDASSNFASALLCPLKYGTMGMEALALGAPRLEAGPTVHHF